MKTILVVDNNIDVLVTIGDLLNRFGYRVIPKTSSKSALSIVKEGTHIDLVILDYKITVYDRDVLSSLRELIPSVPFIVLANDSASNAHLN